MRLATRSMLLLAAYSTEIGAPAEANTALMRAHFAVRLCTIKLDVARCQVQITFADTQL